MYRRVLLLLLPALVLMTALGALPVGYLYAEAVSRDVYLDRATDVAWIAGLMPTDASGGGSGYAVLRGMRMPDESCELRLAVVSPDGREPAVDR